LFSLYDFVFELYRKTFFKVCTVKLYCTFKSPEIFARGLIDYNSSLCFSLLSLGFDLLERVSILLNSFQTVTKYDVLQYTIWNILLGHLYFHSHCQYFQEYVIWLVRLQEKLQMMQGWWFYQSKVLKIFFFFIVVLDDNKHVLEALRKRFSGSQQLIGGKLDEYVEKVLLFYYNLLL
jgi:hypothetical protein